MRAPTYLRSRGSRPPPKCGFLVRTLERLLAEALARLPTHALHDFASLGCHDNLVLTAKRPAPRPRNRPVGIGGDRNGGADRVRQIVIQAFPGTPGSDPGYRRRDRRRL